MSIQENWDVAVVGAGPAGLAAGLAAVTAGARTVIIERAAHPRYKTCGGGLIGASLSAVADHISVPARDQIRAATFTLNGAHQFTRRSQAAPLLAMVMRSDFDDALRQAAEDAGATLLQRSPVRAIEQDHNLGYVRLADGTKVSAKIIVGADGSSGLCARFVGVVFEQVDLGLEVEISIPMPVQQQWRGRILLDWGSIPGSYGWVFPKGDRLTVGVIAARGEGQKTKDYLRQFIDRLELAEFNKLHDSGHLTRCRTENSPLRKGRVIVAGDAAGLLEPWTREGISFALRSGSLAGTMAAKASAGKVQECVDRSLGQYISEVKQNLVPEMRAGKRLLAAFTRHPAAFHIGLATTRGWHAFEKICRSETNFSTLNDRLIIRGVISLLNHT